MLEKTSKAVYRCKSIYKSGDVQKRQGEKLLDPEEACKTRDAKVSPPQDLLG